VNWTVISPHLDDAVFSCGQWLIEHRGATVITVFAGAPADAIAATDWDARCGFSNSTQAMQVRRAEDERALQLVNARAQRLPFLDSQYSSDAPTAATISAVLLDMLSSQDLSQVLLPLGLFHSDHELAHEAAIDALYALRADTVLLYEDAIYRSMPGVVQQRLAALLEFHRRATPAAEQAGPPGRVKEQAVGCYASQLRGLGPRGKADLRCPERIWSMQLDADQA
jgi:LmbE family N-acetylglucosaminyl deacetylase